MSTEANKALLRQFFAYADQSAAGEDIWHHAAEIVAPTFRANVPGAPPLDFQGFRQFVEAFNAGFPGYRHDIEDMIAEGDKALARITWYGTHRGAFQGIPPTGKSAAMAGMNLIRVEDGRIAETWAIFDVMGMLQQLGVIPAGG
ncbi:MAG TPA: ester cyclase [Chloroflexota bacterium]|nr:ester cyclase [Chloroflexota bacterium]